MPDSASMPYVMRVDVPEPAWAALPSRAGVVVFESGDGRTVLIATTGNVRDLARRKLEAGAPGVSKQTDVRSITTLVRAATVGSSLEADEIYLRLVRERLPVTAKAVTERWQGWFVHIDPEEKFPRWTKVATTAMGEGTTAAGMPALARRGVLLGPVRDKHVAARLMELLDDLFDLCREYPLLVLAPGATACAYKEMGKCPAPCDGSETMESYRARVREAVACAADPEAWKGMMEERMQSAAAGMEFELAARLKRKVLAAESLGGATFKRLSTLERFAWMAVTRSEKRGWARVLRVGAGTLEAVADVRIDAAEQAVREMVLEEKGVGLPTGGVGCERADTLGLLCTWLTGAEKAGVEFVRGGEDCGGEIAAACGRVERVKKRRGPKGTEPPASGEPMIDEHSIEPMEP